MPLYTYVMTYAGRTKVHQTRRSNYFGFNLQIAAEVFPEINGDRALQRAIMNTRPAPVESAERVWQAPLTGTASEFVLFVIETRG